MLYAIYVKDGFEREFSGYVNEHELKVNLLYNWNHVTNIRAECDELEKCCEILGRRRPSFSVYCFTGNNAKEIAANWYIANS